MVQNQIRKKDEENMKKQTLLQDELWTSYLFYLHFIWRMLEYEIIRISTVTSLKLFIYNLIFFIQVHISKSQSIKNISQLDNGYAYAKD